jgi:hypothetical protein
LYSNEPGRPAWVRVAVTFTPPASGGSVSSYELTFGAMSASCFRDGDSANYRRTVVVHASGGVRDMPCSYGRNCDMGTTLTAVGPGGRGASSPNAFLPPPVPHAPVVTDAHWISHDMFRMTFTHDRLSVGWTTYAYTWFRYSVDRFVAGIAVQPECSALAVGMVAACIPSGDSMLVDVDLAKLPSDEVASLDLSCMSLWAANGQIHRTISSVSESSNCVALGVRPV